MCLHGQHGPKQQRAFAYRSHRQPLLREDCTERVKARPDRATQSWVVVAFTVSHKALLGQRRTRRVYQRGAFSSGAGLWDGGTTDNGGDEEEE